MERALEASNPMRSFKSFCDVVFGWVIFRQVSGFSRLISVRVYDLYILHTSLHSKTSDVIRHHASSYTKLFNREKPHNYISYSIIKSTKILAKLIISINSLNKQTHTLTGHVTHVRSDKIVVNVCKLMNRVKPDKTEIFTDYYTKEVCDSIVQQH